MVSYGMAYGKRKGAMFIQTEKTDMVPTAKLLRTKIWTQTASKRVERTLGPLEHTVDCG